MYDDPHPPHALAVAVMNHFFGHAVLAQAQRVISVCRAVS
jgi:hypothetical protein